MQAQQLVFVLYDSIENSIFDGQVLQPLLKKQQTNSSLHITLISFESKRPSAQKLAELNHLPNVSVIVINRYPFLGVSSLLPAINQLKTCLKNLSAFELIARGPLAGWLAINALDKTNCKQLTIQIRGLLAEEYLYAHQNTKYRINKRLYEWRALQYENLERKLYSFEQKKSYPIMFEAVSPALKEYIIKKYGLDPQRTTIADHDIPEPLNTEDKKKWRAAIRTQLGLSDSPHIYCYNGSVKQWQCPEKVIEFFKSKLNQNNNCFLLILTQDKKQFEQLLKRHEIDPARFYVASIAHKDVYRYLAACDSGLLFREKNIINWVSRPTKVLEYKAAGLTIIHDNTIAYLNSKQIQLAEEY